MSRDSAYSTPKFKYGEVVFDDVRGEVEIVGLSDATIPWPIGKKRNAKSLVVYQGLATALHFESNATVCELWGITPQTVSKWRKELGVERANSGTVQRLRQMMTPAKKAKMDAARAPTYRDPQRLEKIRQARLGQPRPKSLMKKLREASLGRKWTDDQRRQLMAARIRRHPKSYEPWTAEEDLLVRMNSIRRVVELTGRSKRVVELRRKELGVTRQSTATTAAKLWNDNGRR
ncbi:MAG: hypothetical protein JWP89_2348 [Schlesneria sp.]|nr:hypothetical protein [Schlesneria sp.]